MNETLPAAHAVLRVAQLLFNTPLLCTPDCAETIAAALAPRWGLAGEAETSRFVGAPVRKAGADGHERTMFRAQDGVALITVTGELVNRGAWVGASSGLTSYEGLDAQLRAADADPQIRAIVLDVDSPGGQASGAMETGALVRAIAGRKPIAAFVNGQACSAAYAIVSGATRIVVAPSATVGSIGVVWMHVDRSKQIASAGLKPTLLHAGAFKVDGHSLGALAEDARARIMAQIDAIYALFVDTVSAHRGLSPAAVRATEAGVFMGQAAVEAGLADHVGGLDDALSLINQDRGAPLVALSAQPESLAMTTQNTPAAPDAAALAAARGEGHAAGRAEGLETGRREGAEAARARIAAILSAPEAEARESTARALALETDLPAEAAAKVLATTPKAGAAAPPPPRQPGLGAHVPRPDVQPDAAAPAAPASDYEQGLAAFAAVAPKPPAAAAAAAPAAPRV